MAQPAPGKFRLTEHQTNDAIFQLEERKYGKRLNSMELAQKANVSLDFVNCIENQRPVEDRSAIEGIANALGITADLLDKVAGAADFTDPEWAAFQNCLTTSTAGQSVPQQCERLGFRRIWE